MLVMGARGESRSWGAARWDSTWPSWALLAGVCPCSLPAGPFPNFCLLPAGLQQNLGAWWCCHACAPNRRPCPGCYVALLQTGVPSTAG